MVKSATHAKTIGVRELKNKLSATLKRVREGSTVTVTDRGQPVALIVPVRAVVDDDVLRQLVATGRLSYDGGKPEGSPRPRPVQGQPVSDAVIEDRR
jgi:prevent-host-death family protein